MAEVRRGVQDTVYATLDRLVPSGPLGVAISGGSDSMALLVLARAWAKARGRALHAVTVDHGLRPESASEASVVARTCSEWSVPHEVLKAEDLSGAGNLQAAAREARYRLMSGWAVRQGLGAVALGHTLDDQAETVLMRLGRGAGAEGLSGMAAARDWLGTHWIRPLLGVRREDLRDLLNRHEIGWLEDPSNEDPRFDRVKARQALAALAPLGISAEGLAETAATMMRQRQVLTDAMERLAAQAREWQAVGTAQLSLDGLRRAVPDTALRLFADTLMRVSGSPYRARFRSLEPAFVRLTGEAPEALTLSGCVLRPDEDTVLICREPAAVEPPLPLDQGQTDWDQRWRVSVSMSEGLLVSALGQDGRAVLAEAEDEDDWTPPDGWTSLPAEVQLTVPAIWEDAGGGVPWRILAVPHAGYVADGTAHLGEIAVDHLHRPSK